MMTDSQLQVMVQQSLDDFAKKEKQKFSALTNQIQNTNLNFL